MRRLVTPGLRDDAAIVEVDLEDPVEFPQPQQHAVGQWQGAARKRRSGAARDDLYASLAAVLEDRCDLLRGLGQNDDEGNLPVGGEPVALVGLHLLRRGDNALRRQQAPEVGDDLIAGPEYGTVRFGHAHGRRSPRHSDPTLAASP